MSRCRATANQAEHLAMFRSTQSRHVCKTAGTPSIYDEQGDQDGAMAALYRGCVPVLTLPVPAHGAYLVSMKAKRRFAADQSNYGFALAAACATMAHDAVSIPFDVVTANAD